MGERMAMADESRKLVRNIIVKGFDQHARDGDIYGRPAAHDGPGLDVTPCGYDDLEITVLTFYLAVTMTC